MKIRFALFTLVVLFFISCNSDNKKITIGINQFAQHPILDEVYSGIKERLSKEKNIEIIYKVSNADINISTQINNQFVANDVSLIIALGTPVAQSAIKSTKTIPIVFGAITDPVGAGLANSLDKPGGNKTGTTNRWPFEKQVSLIKIIKPNVKNVGIIVNPGEDNCNFGMIYIKKALDFNKISYTELPIMNTSEIMSVMSSLISKCYLLLISPSNTVISSMPSIIKIANENNVMVIGGDKSSVEKGSVISYAYDDHEIGISTAEVAMKILNNKVNPGDLPVIQPPNAKIYFNQTSADKYKISLPDSVKQQIFMKY